MNDTIKNLHEALISGKQKLISEKQKWERENIFLEHGDKVNVSVARLEKVYRGRITRWYWYNCRLCITIEDKHNEEHSIDFAYFKDANEQARLKKGVQNEH